MIEATETYADPELYLRANITKNTKGYSSELTGSVRATGTVDEVAAMLQELLLAGAAVVRTEIERRERQDAADEAAR